MALDPNIPIPTYPTTEATSALTYGYLLEQVAYKMGCAYYGSTGTGAPQVPIDPHDLALCQNIVNDAIRMFIHDAPQPNGWKWLNVIGQVDLWPQISYDPTGSTYVTMVDNGNSTTTFTLTTSNFPPSTGDIDTSYVPQFYQSMELRQIWLNGNPPSSGVPGWWAPVDEQYTGSTISLNPYTILSYNGPTSITVDNGSTSPTVAVSVSVYSASLTGNVATLSTNNVSTLTVGSIVNVSGLTGLASTLNGNGFTLLSASPSTITYALTAANVASSTYTGSTTKARVPFSFASQGDYTMPANFGGQYTGELTYIANTNRGMILTWTTEGAIRARRQNYNIESGTPYEAAVRLMPTPSYAILTNASGTMTPRRRWELMTWRISSEFLSVIFPYTLAFNNLVNLTDVSPAPYAHDESIKAACYALVEKQTNDAYGPDWQYYRTICLPNSYRVDAMSAPKKLGYFGNPRQGQSGLPGIRSFRDYLYQRPTVPVFGLS